MKLQHAKEGATSAAVSHGLPIAIVNEGVHADEYAERDDDGNSYGYCPESAVSLLYRFGTVVQVIAPQ